MSLPLLQRVEHGSLQRLAIGSVRYLRDNLDRYDDVGPIHQRQRQQPDIVQKMLLDDVNAGATLHKARSPAFFLIIDTSTLSTWNSNELSPTW